METKILSIDVKEAVDRLAKLTRQIELLTAQNSELKKEIKELNAAGQAEIVNARAKSAEFEKNHKAISILTAERRVLRRELENSIRQNTEEAGSLRALRAEVSRLTSVYDSLSRVRREGAEGQALLEKIQKTTKELNLAEQASLRFQRNVGNYQSAFGNLHFQVQQLARELPSLSYGFNVFVGAISNNLPMLVDEVARARREYAELMKTDPSKAVPVWKQLFSAVFSWQTALVAGITILTLYGREIGEWVQSLFTAKKAITETYKELESFQKSVQDSISGPAVEFEALSQKWKKLGGSITKDSPIYKEAVKYFNNLGIAVNSVAEAEKILIDYKDEFIEAMKEKALSAATMEVAMDEYENMLKKELEIKELEKDLAGEESKTGFSRREGVVQATKGVLSNANKERSEHEVNYKELVDDANAYSESYYAILEKLGLSTLEKTTAKTRDMKAIQLEELRKAEDELLKLVKDARAREYKEMEFFYGRQIEDLKARLENEKDLSVKARKAINDQISALEQQRANKRRELSEEALQDQIKAKQTEIEKQLELIEEGTQAEFDIKRQALTDLEALELKSAELTEAQKEEIRKRYAKKRADLESELIAEINRRQSEAMKARFEKELAELQSIQSKKLENIIASGANEEQVEQAKLASELQMIQKQHAQYLEEYDNMKQQEGETDEQFAARRADVLANADEAQMQATEVKAQMMANAYRSVVDGIEELGEVSESFAALSKVLALAEIAYNTGKALAAGIASAAAQPFPANLAAIATTVGIIMTNMAQATKIVNSFKKKEEKKKFATGGLVEGEGTATSDSIPAMLSNGESVMTAAATSMFAPVLSAFNQIGGGVPIQATETANSVAGEEMLARAFMQGAAALPSPVVSVVDINAGQKRVAQVESLASL